jgi:aspartyl protease family protein
MKRLAQVGLGLLLLIVLADHAAALTPGEANAAGMAAYARGDYAAAERLFSAAVAATPNEPLYHYHRGAARASYERALRLKPPATLAETISAALREFGGSGRRAVAEADTVPIESANGVWFTDVVLNGSQRARFVVDTGATSCTISPELAEALGIQVADDSPTVEIMTLTGKTKGHVVSLDSIKVGETEALDVSTVVHEFQDGIQGILGNSFLGRYAVTLDAQRRLLHLRPRQ